MWILKQMKTVSGTSGVTRTIEPGYAFRLPRDIRIVRGGFGWARKRID
jgi:hypothetical protein